jgi:hypothetical protein
MYLSTRVALSIVLIFLFCLAPKAFAQGGTGQLSGTVVDPNGAVITGASVKLTSRARPRNGKPLQMIRATSLLLFCLQVSTHYRSLQMAFARL